MTESGFELGSLVQCQSASKWTASKWTASKSVLLYNGEREIVGKRIMEKNLVPLTWCTCGIYGKENRQLLGLKKKKLLSEAYRVSPLRMLEAN